MVVFAVEGPYPLLAADALTIMDTETTGLWAWGVKEDGGPSGDPHGRDRICSIGMIKLRKQPGNVWKFDRSLHLKMDPRRPVPEQAAVVNGFHWSGDGSDVPADREDLRGQPTFQEKADRIMRFIGNDPVVCHNTVFDVGFLDAELEQAGLALLDVPVICTKKSFAEMSGLGRPDHYVPGTNLNALCALLGIPTRGRTTGASDAPKFHDALDDAWLVRECLPGLDRAGWLVAEDPALLPHRRRLTKAQTLAV
jgi:DNA polymerase-3 subunit epsilon